MRVFILPIILLCYLTSTGQEMSKLKISTIDIDHFYNAFHLFAADSANAHTIFEKNYFNPGTSGLKDFYKYKIKDKQKFVSTLERRKTFYASIEKELKQIHIYKDTIVSNYLRFKEAYPKAKFGHVYFVVGRLSSNGTISKNGLIIGAELLSKTPVNSIMWSDDLKKIVLNFDHIPVTVFHEMIHFNQRGTVNEGNLLSYALREGAAEFLTELFLGEADGDYHAFIGRESAIWSDFEKEMFEDIYASWHRENEPLRPRNALYWVGYYICKSFYENAADKSQAVYDILNIKSSRDFYNKSKVTDKIKQLSTASIPKILK